MDSKPQLLILKEIQDIVSALDLKIWVRGGWAIDFHLGRITREHSDLDLVAWIKHRELLEKELVRAGYKKIPVSEYQTDFLKKDVDASIVFVCLSDNGEIFANSFPEWVWTKGALPDRQHTLEGVTSRVLSPQQLLQEKEVYEQGTGKKLRPKDRKSIEMIKKIIEKEVKKRLSLERVVLEKNALYTHFKK